MRRLRSFIRRVTARDERGATVPEYALAVSLFALVVVGSVQVVVDRGSDRIEGSDTRIGTPTDNAAYSLNTTTTFGAPSPTTPTIPSTGLVVAQITAVPAPSQGSPASKWIANVTITVTDPSGNPVSGVVVQGSWDATGNPAENAGNCTTVANGTCTVQRPDINDNTQIVRFTISSMTKEGYVSYTGTPTYQGEVNCTSQPGIC